MPILSDVQSACLPTVPAKHTHTHTEVHPITHSWGNLSSPPVQRRPMQRQWFGTHSAWDMGLHFPVVKYPESSVGILKCPWGLGGKCLGPGRGRAFPNSSDGSAAPRAPEPQGRPWRRPHVLRCSYGEWDGGGGSSQLFQLEQHRRKLSAMSESHPAEAPLPLQVCSEHGPQDP